MKIFIKFSIVAFLVCMASDSIAQAIDIKSGVYFPYRLVEDNEIIHRLDIKAAYGVQLIAKQ